MTTLQVAVNIVLAIIFVAIVHFIFDHYVKGVPGLLVFLVDLLLVIGTFASNVAARLSVK